MEGFTENVIQMIQSIPEGKVLTYGEIARALGSPKGARQVARILHTMSKKYNLPWHRVVNSHYQISIKDPDGAKIQKQLLEAEGHLFLGNQLVKGELD